MATNSPGSIDSDISCRSCRLPTRRLTLSASTLAPRVLNGSIFVGSPKDSV